MFGVKYYMAISDGMISLGRANPSLTEVAASGPWVVFEVADSALVEPLDNQPAVLTDVKPHDWLDAVTPWYLDPGQWNVYPAAGGPSDWQRISPDDVPTEFATTPVAVTDISRGQRLHRVRRQRRRPTGAGEGVVLPELAGRRGQGALARRART